MSLAPDDKWDTENKVLKNVADGVADTDGVNLLQVTSITSGDAAAAAASAAAALVSEGLADADATQTAANVATTNADVISTNADVVSTNADAVSTAADALATAADALATAADAIATAADAASTASDATDTGIDAAATASDVITTAGSVVSAANSAAAAAADLVLTNADVVSCAASYDSFDDRYLGSKTTAPALDNDGNALLTGALYWNSTANLMKVYTGSVWNTVGNAELAALTPTKGNLIAGNGSAFINRTVGADDTVLTADSTEADGVKWAVPASVSVFRAAGQVNWSAGTVYSWAHGLGGQPDIVNGHYECVTANQGFVPGDIANFTWQFIYGVGTYGGLSWGDATHVGVQARTSQYVSAKTGSGTVTIDRTKWKITATAIKF